jgi:hypothetical protein
MINRKKKLQLKWIATKRSWKGHVIAYNAKIEK